MFTHGTAVFHFNVMHRNSTYEFHVNFSMLSLTWWAGQRSRYSDWLQAGRSGDRIPVGGEIFRTCPDRPWGPPSLLYSGYWVFPGGKERPGRDADPTPPSSAVVKKGQSYTSTPLWAVRPVQSLSACTRVHFLHFRIMYQKYFNFYIVRILVMRY